MTYNVFYFLPGTELILKLTNNLTNILKTLRMINFSILVSFVGESAFLQKC